MKFWVGVTDNRWYGYLAERQPDEVNFWRPKSTAQFRAIEPGGLFLFKLHAPLNYIAGGGFFLQHSVLPLSLAWEAFGDKNGADDFTTFREHIWSIRRDRVPDPHIGCTILVEPFFWKREHWINVPEDWSRNLVQGRTYSTDNAIGARLWKQLQERLDQKGVSEQPAQIVAEEKTRYGEEFLTRARLGQGSFRVFEEIFCSEFTRSNFGFLRGKSQHQAIGHVRGIVVEGYEWCASIDLKSFFDKIPHGLILKLIRRNVADERLITMIARALKAGVIVEGRFEKTIEGCPQGSPLSPMLSNIVLNELDQELERRGLRYARWADDFVILVKSERAAKRVMEGTIRYLEEELGLPVNTEKSQVAKVKDVPFVSFQVRAGKIRVSDKARTRFKIRVRQLTRRNNPLSMYQVTQNLNEYLRGWVAYFRIQESQQRLFRDLDAWTRSRLRSMQLKKWKKPRKFQRMMIRAGFQPQEARRTRVKMNRWQSVNRKEVRFVLDLRRFRKQGLFFPHDFTRANPELPFGR
jgi:RNA-directed DNA polymerase